MTMYNKPLRVYAVRDASGWYYGGNRSTFDEKAHIYVDEALAMLALEDAKEYDIFCELVTFDLVEVPKIDE